jgi:hypothetical protein
LGVLGRTPPQVFDAIGFADDGARLLAKAPPDKLIFTSAPVGISSVCLKPQPNDLRKVQVALCVGAVLCWIIMWPLDRFGWMDDFEFRYFAHASTPFTYLGFGMVGVAIFLLLIQMASGPGRDTLVEIRPGHVKIDRYCAGDHVVREYTPAEVRAATLIDGIITLYIPTGEVHLAVPKPVEFQRAFMAIMAVGLWQESTFLAGPMRISRATVELLAVNEGDREEFADTID